MRVSTILAPLDLSPLSDGQFEAAVQVAQLFGVDRLHLVNADRAPPAWVQQFPVAPPRFAIDLTMDRRERVRANLCGYLPPVGSSFEVTREVVSGGAAEAVVEAAVQASADLLVLGMRRRSDIDRAILGSVAHTIIRAAPCPTLVLNQGHHFRTPRKIVAAVDLSPVSARVVDGALGFAQAAARALADPTPSVEVVSCSDLCWILPDWADAPPVVLDDRERAQLVQSQAAALDALIRSLPTGGVQVTRKIIEEAPPWKMIVERAEAAGADLIVIGSSGHSAWQRFFMGSTAMKVLAHASCPVLVVPTSTASPVSDED